MNGWRGNGASRHWIGAMFPVAIALTLLVERVLDGSGGTGGIVVCPSPTITAEPSATASLHTIKSITENLGIKILELI